MPDTRNLIKCSELTQKQLLADVQSCPTCMGLYKEAVTMSSPVVLITGALTGIGRAAAIIFAQEGAHIVVSGRRDKEGQELVAKLQGLRAEAGRARGARAAGVLARAAVL